MFFFVTYTCVITFIILNLFVAVVLEGFDDSNSGDDDVTVERCVDVWKKFDPNLTMKLPWLKATAFVEVALRSLEGGAVPDGASAKAGKEHRFAVQQAEISRMEIDEKGEVTFKSATLAVLRLLMPKEELQGVLKIEEMKEAEEAFQEESLDIRAQVAALALQEAFKRKRAARIRDQNSAARLSQASQPGNSVATDVGALSTPANSSPERDSPTPAKPKEVPEGENALPPRDLPPGVLSPDKLRELEEKRGEPDAAG